MIRQRAHRVARVVLLGLGLSGCGTLLGLDDYRVALAPDAGGLGECAPPPEGLSRAPEGIEQVACPAQGCQGGELSCDGLTPRVCSEGRWVPRASCDLGCVEGRCTECSGGQRCRDGGIEACLGGFWQHSTTCAVLCEDGACLDSCTEGRTQCNAERLQRCQGGDYVDEEDCALACVSTDQGDRCGGECRRGSARCVPDGSGNPTNATQACGGDALWSLTTTPCGGAFCVAGVCKPCEPGTRHCGEAGPELCSLDGEWAPEAACGAELPACFGGVCSVCTPNSVRCDLGAVEACNEAGSAWVTQKECTGDTPACLDDIKDCGRCALGERQCSGDSVQGCDASGNYQEESSCAGDTPDCVDGACRACDPVAGDRRCSGPSSLQGCAADGSWATASACAGDTPLCREDLGRCGCEENARRCASDGSPERCVGGSWVLQSRCSGGTPVCLPATGECVACSPGNDICQNNVVQRCDATGSYQSTGECGSERVNCGNCDVGEPCPGGNGDCQSGACVSGACAVCRPRTTQCVGTTPRTCAPEGNWVNAAPCTGDRPVCVAQTAACACQAGAVRCASSAAERRCIGGQFVESACAAGSLCEVDHCQAQEWTRQFGTTAADKVESVSVDGSGNVFVAGATGGTLPAQSSAGASDAYLRKYDSSGRELWTRQFGTANGETVHSVSVGANGSAFVAGFTNGELPGQTSSDGVGRLDAFVRKYDTNGNEIWTRQFGSDENDSASSVRADSKGGAVVVGTTGKALAGQTSSGGSADLFVRKYDADGTEIWTRQFGSGSSTESPSVDVDARGNVFVAGNTLDALPGQASSGSRDAFLRKYDTNGTEIWTRQFGSSGIDLVAGVSVDSSGNATIAGHAAGTLPGQTGAVTFVRKYDANGDEIWTRQFGSGGADSASGVSSDANGNIVVAGSAVGTSAGIVRTYDANGTELRTRQLGPTSVLAVNVDASGNVIAAGVVEGSLSGQASAGGFDAFVMKLVE
jgi:Beta-propeller repeat